VLGIDGEHLPHHYFEAVGWADSFTSIQ
jgi:hypothetical protein